MKLVVHYLILVGLPVLGVLGVLRVGKTLRPPVSVNGQWNVEVGKYVRTDSRCEGLPTQSGPFVLSISQSGTRLSLLFNKQSKLEGEIRSTNISARSIHPSGSAVSDNGNGEDGLRLGATLDGEARQERLFGTLSFSGCTAAPEINFVATRQSNPPPR